MKFKFLSKYFPSPEYLKPPHVGITFSDTNIKAVWYDRYYPRSSLMSMIVPLEKGAIVAGKIVDANEVVEKLSMVRKDLDSRFVFFAVPDEIAYVFSTSVPINKGGDIRESIAFILEENAPLSVADAVFDFTPIEVVGTEAKAETEQTAFLVVAACAKKEVEKFTSALVRAGFEPVGCVHESQTIANALMPKKSKGTSCIVHARENRVAIFLVKDGVVHFVTIRAIIEGDYQKQFLDEYDKFLEYALKYSISKEEPIKTISVCGEFEYAKKITEAIINSPHSVKDVKLSNVWTNIFRIEKEVPDISFEDSLNLAEPMGATLSDII